MLFVEPDVDCFRIDLKRISLPTDLLALEPEAAQGPLANATRISPSVLSADARKAGEYAGWQPGRILPAMALLGAHQKPRLLIEEGTDTRKGSAPDADTASDTKAAEKPAKKPHAYTHITLDDRADVLHRALLSTLYARFPYELKDTIEHVYVLVLTHMAPPSFSAQPLTVEEIAELTTYHQFLPAELRYRTHPSHLGPLLDPIVVDSAAATPPATTSTEHDESDSKRAGTTSMPTDSAPTAAPSAAPSSRAPFQLPKFYDTFFIMARDLSAEQKTRYRQLHGDAQIARRGLAYTTSGVSALPTEATAQTLMGAQEAQRGDEDAAEEVGQGMTGFSVVDGHFTHYVLSTADEDEQRAAQGNRKVDGEGITMSLDDLAERQWEQQQQNAKAKQQHAKNTTTETGTSGSSSGTSAAPLSDRQRRMTAREAARTLHFGVYRLPLNLFDTDDQRFYMHEREELRFHQCHATTKELSQSSSSSSSRASESDGSWWDSLSRQREKDQTEAMKAFFTSEMPSRYRSERDDAQRHFFKQCHDILFNMVVSRLAPPRVEEEQETQNNNENNSNTKPDAAGRDSTTTTTAKRESQHEVSQLVEQKAETKTEDVIIIAPPEPRRTAARRRSSAASLEAGEQGGAPPAAANEEAAAEVQDEKKSDADPAQRRPSLRGEDAVVIEVSEPSKTKPRSTRVGPEEDPAQPLQEARARKPRAVEDEEAVGETAPNADAPKPPKRKGPSAAMLARLNKKTATPRTASPATTATTTAAANNKDEAKAGQAARTQPGPRAGGLPRRVGRAGTTNDDPAQMDLKEVTEAAKEACREETAAAAAPAGAAPASSRADADAAVEPPTKSSASKPCTTPPSSPPSSSIPPRVPGVSCVGVTRLLYSLVPCDCYHMVMDDVNPLYYAKSSRAAYAPHSITLGLISDLSMTVTTTASRPSVAPTRPSSQQARGAGSGLVKGGEASQLAVRASAGGGTAAPRQVYAPSRMSGLLNAADGKGGLEPGKLYFITEDGLVSSRPVSRAPSPEGSGILRGGDADGDGEKARRSSTNRRSARRSTASAVAAPPVPVAFDKITSSTDGYLLVRVALTCNDISGNPKHEPETLRMKGARLPEYLAGSGGNEQASSSAAGGGGENPLSPSSSSSSSCPVVDLFKALANSTLAQHKLRFGAIRPVVSVAVLDGTAVLDGSLFAEKQHEMARGELFGDGVGGHSAPGGSGGPPKSQQSRDFTCRGLVDHTWVSVPVQTQPRCQEAVQWMPVVLGSTDCISDVGYRTAVHLGFFTSDERRRRHEEAAKEEAEARVRRELLGEGAEASARRSGRDAHSIAFRTSGTLPTRAGALSSLTPSAPLPSRLAPLAASSTAVTSVAPECATIAAAQPDGGLLGDRNVNAPQKATGERRGKGGVAFSFSAAVEKTPSTATAAPETGADAATRPPLTATHPRKASGGVAFDFAASAPTTTTAAAVGRRPAIPKPRTRTPSFSTTTYTKPAALFGASSSQQTGNRFDDVPAVAPSRRSSAAAASRPVPFDEIPVGPPQKNAAQGVTFDDIPAVAPSRRQPGAPRQVPFDEIPIVPRQRNSAQGGLFDDVPAVAPSRLNSTAQRPFSFDEVPVRGAVRRSQTPPPSRPPPGPLHIPGQPSWGRTPPPPQQRPSSAPLRRSHTPPPPSSQLFRALDYESTSFSGVRDSQGHYRNPFSAEAVRLSTVRRSGARLTEQPFSPSFGHSTPPAGRPTVNVFNGGAQSGAAGHYNNNYNNNNSSTSWLAVGGTTGVESHGPAVTWGGQTISSPLPRNTTFGSTTRHTATYNNNNNNVFNNGGSVWSSTRTPQQQQQPVYDGRFSNMMQPRVSTPFGASRNSAMLPSTAGHNIAGPDYFEARRSGGGGGGGFFDGDEALNSPISPLTPSASRMRFGGERQSAQRIPQPSASARYTSTAWQHRETLGVPSATRGVGSEFSNPSFAINEYNDVPRPGSRVRTRGVTAMDDAWARPVRQLTSAPAFRQAPRSTLGRSTAMPQSARSTQSSWSNGARPSSSVLGRPPLASRPPLYPSRTPPSSLSSPFARTTRTTASGRLAASRGAALSVRERLAARKAEQERVQNLRDYDAGLRENYMVGSDAKRVRFEVPVTIAEPMSGRQTRALRTQGADHSRVAATASSGSSAMQQQQPWNSRAGLAPAATAAVVTAPNWEACLSPAQVALEAEAQARSLGQKQVQTVREAAVSAEAELLTEQKARTYQAESHKLKYMADMIDDSCDGVNVSFTLRDIANAFLLMPCGRPSEQDVCQAAWSSEGVSYFLSRKPQRLAGGWESYMARLNVYQEPFYLRDQAFVLVLRVPHHPQLRVCVAIHNVNDLLALLQEKPVACILPTQDEIWLQERRYANSEYDRYWYDGSSDDEDDDGGGGGGQGGRVGTARSSHTGWRAKSSETVIVETRWFFGLLKSTKRIRVVKDSTSCGTVAADDGAATSTSAPPPSRVTTEEEDVRRRRARHRAIRRQFQADGLRFTWRHRLALWWLQMRSAWHSPSSALCTSPLLTDPACFKARASFLSDRIAAYAAVQHRINTLKAIREAYIARRAEELVRQRTLRICDRTQAEGASGVALGTAAAGFPRTAATGAMNSRMVPASAPNRALDPSSAAAGGGGGGGWGGSRELPRAAITSPNGRRAVGGIAMTFDPSGHLTTTTAGPERPEGPPHADAHRDGPRAALLERLSSKRPLSSATSSRAPTPTSAALSRRGSASQTAASAGTTANLTAAERRKRIMAAARQSAHTGQKATLSNIEPTMVAGPHPYPNPHQLQQQQPWHQNAATQLPFSYSPHAPSASPWLGDRPPHGSTIDHYAASATIQRGAVPQPGALVERGAGLDLVLRVQRSDELAKALERVAARREAQLVAPLTTALRVVPRSEQVVRGAGGGVVKSDAEGLLYAGVIPTPLEIHRLLETYNITVRQLQQLLQWQWEHHQHSYELVPLPIFRDAIVPAVDEYFRFLGQQRERFTGAASGFSTSSSSTGQRLKRHFENPFIESSPHWQNAAPMGTSPLARVLLLFAARWSWLVPINYEASRRSERLFFLEDDVRRALTWQLSPLRVLVYIAAFVWMSQCPGTALCLALGSISVYGLVCVVRSACGLQSRAWRPRSQRVTHPLDPRENVMPLIDDRTSLLYRQSEGAAAALLERQHDFPAQAMITRVLQVQAFLSSIWSRTRLGLQCYSPLLWLCLVALCLTHLGLYVCYQRLMDWVMFVNGGWCGAASRVAKDTLQALLPLVGVEGAVDASVLDALEQVREAIRGGGTHSSDTHKPSSSSSSWWWPFSGRSAASKQSAGAATTATDTVAAYSQEGVDGKPHTYYQNGEYYTYGGRNEPVRGNAAYAAYARRSAAAAGARSAATTKTSTTSANSHGTGAAAFSAGREATALNPSLVSAWNTFASTIARLSGSLENNPAGTGEHAYASADNITVWHQNHHAGGRHASGGHAFVPFLFFVYLVIWWLPRSPVRALWRRTWAILVHDDSLARRPLLSF